jgi:hypothetical protein
MSSNSPLMTALKIWDKLDKEKTIDWMQEKLYHFRIGIAVNGDYIDRNSDPYLRIRPNKLKCILRHEYEADSHLWEYKLSGKALNYMLDCLIQSLAEVAKLPVEETQCAMEKCFISDAYIQ